MDVSDRRPQAQLTQEAKIASDFSLFRAIFAFAGFVSALTGDGRNCRLPQTIDKLLSMVKKFLEKGEEPKGKEAERVENIYTKQTRRWERCSNGGGRNSSKWRS